MKHNVMLFLSEKYEYCWFINQIHHDPIHEKQGGKFSIHTVVATLS